MADSDLGTPVLPLLPLLEEPVALRGELRRSLLDGEDWEQAHGPDLGIGDALWAQWAAALEPAGMSRQGLSQVIAGYRREVWFWLLGDRRWEQVAQGLSGRVLRRLPPA